MSAPIPVLLLTGYLGAGKTTTLNHLLQLPYVREQDVALIINEFGQYGVDGQLVDAGDQAVYELNKGSLFCICIKTDFLKTLREIAAEPRPDLVIVEATGIAEPRDLEDFVDEPALADLFAIQANICLVDAAGFVQVAPMLQAARRQVQWADGLVLNKTDTIPPADLDTLQDVLHELNPDAPQVCVSWGRVPADFCRGLTHRRQSADPLTAPPDPIFAETFSPAAALDRNRFETAVNELGDRLLRLKGYIDFGDGPVFVEVVNGRLSIADTPRPERAGSSFVAIAWHLSQADLRGRLTPPEAADERRA